MRILVVGAGAIGGYFGGRLKDAGRDVTFLVRERRAAQLAKTGLVIRSPLGDVSLPSPPTVMADALREPFDLILLSCKAAILPLLNGMAHMDFLGARFGAGSVLGSQCVISTTLDSEGRILHLNDTHLLSFGEPGGALSDRAKAIASTLSSARFDSKLSEIILQEMWEKWVLIATMASITCLMRATVGDIVAANAGEFATAILEECSAIAAAQGYAPRDAITARNRTMLTTRGSGFAASMLRDIERGAPIEADHIVGDLLRRGEKAGRNSPLLHISYAHLKAYEARRTREKAATPTA